MLLNTLNEIDSPHQQLIKLLGDNYPEFMKNLIDAMTTAIVKSHGVKGFKGLFKKKADKQEKTGEVVILKDGTRVRMKNS